MKTKLFVPVFFLILVFVTSCKKQANESFENQKLIENSENIENRKAVPAEFNNDVYQQMVADNDTRIAFLNQGNVRGRGCVHTAIVPDNYGTIQEAMDVVCDYGNIIVNSGTYNENVLINKPGLNIKAIGEVIVNGTFFLYSVADYVKIQRFTIKPVYNGNSGSFNGIYGSGIKGAEIKQNIIVGNGNDGFGIVLDNSNGNSIKQNQVSDFAWGIIFRSVDEEKSSSNNTIQNNTVSGITYASCIGLEGNCDNNLIMGNLIAENTYTVNAGIFFYNYFSDGMLTDNNVIKNNEVTFNEWTGIWIDGGNKNTIGPNNICNNSYTDIGIYLSYTVTNTKVFNNTALYNEYCDFVFEDGADFSLQNNTFGCSEMW